MPGSPSRIRAGFEKIRSQTAYRLGIIIPLELKTSTQDFTTDLPAPFLPTFGIGWDLTWADINLAVYPNPLMSSTKNSVEISADLSLLFKF